MVTKQEYLRRWKEGNLPRYIKDVWVEKSNINDYTVRIKNNRGGENSAGLFPFENEEERKIAYKLAQQYAKKIKLAKNVIFK